MTEVKSILQLSLFFNLESRRVPHAAGLQLCLAAVPQVNHRLVDVEQDHGGSGAQAAAMTRNLQQMALYWNLTPDNVQTPLIWRHREEYRLKKQ